MVPRIIQIDAVHVKESDEEFLKEVCEPLNVGRSTAVPRKEIANRKYAQTCVPSNCDFNVGEYIILDWIASFLQGTCRSFLTLCTITISLTDCAVTCGNYSTQMLA